MGAKAPTREEVERYMALGTDALLDDLSIHAEAAGVPRGVGETWDRLEDRLRQVVCEDWGWCARRKGLHFEDNIALAFAVAQVLAPAALPFTAPAAPIAVILVKRGLDDFCGCS